MATLTDLEIVKKYALADPLFDALYFAQLVNALATARRAHLAATISYKQGELVALTYTITGFDSTGEALFLKADSGLSVLANCIRELNKRYAARQADRRSTY